MLTENHNVCNGADILLALRMLDARMRNIAIFVLPISLSVITHLFHCSRGGNINLEYSKDAP
jgi:hypothetical protein